MGFSQTQIDALSAPLDRKHVKSRSQAGRSLSYVEGWHAIAEANRIFGFGGWDRETVDLRECGETRQVGDKFRVAFICRVRIKVRSGDDDNWDAVVRDGTGYGSGIDKDLGQAYESAVKEAETDAMKRALMTFGNPFGLALYDKEQANVAEASAPVAPAGPRPAYTDIWLREINECVSARDLDALKRSPEFKAAWSEMNETERAVVKAAAEAFKPRIAA